VHEGNFFPTLSPTFAVVYIVHASHPNRSEANLGMVYISISFMASWVFLHVFLAIWTSSIEKGLFSSFAYFSIGSLLFWEFSF
jgi:hypothetical protein